MIVARDAILGGVAYDGREGEGEEGDDDEEDDDEDEDGAAAAAAAIAADVASSSPPPAGSRRGCDMRLRVVVDRNCEAAFFLLPPPPPVPPVRDASARSSGGDVVDAELIVVSARLLRPSFQKSGVSNTSIVRGLLCSLPSIPFCLLEGEEKMKFKSEPGPAGRPAALSSLSRYFECALEF